MHKNINKGVWIYVEVRIYLKAAEIFLKPSFFLLGDPEFSEF